MQLSLKEILAAFMVLFAIIDIPGSIPIIIDIKSKGVKVNSIKVTISFPSDLSRIPFHRHSSAWCVRN